MDPELLKLLQDANKARREGYTVAQIDAALRAEGQPAYAELSRMAREAGGRPTPSVDIGPVRQFLRGAARGATFGGLEELQGVEAAIPRVLRPVVEGRPAGQAVTSLLRGLRARPDVEGRFGEVREAEQAATRELQERAPVASLAAEVAGGVGTGGVGLARLFAARGLPALGRMAVGAGAGGVGGATFGGLDAEGADQVAEDMAAGGRAGFFIGGAIPGSLALAGALSRFPRTLAQVLWGAIAPGQTGRALAIKQLRDYVTRISKSRVEELEEAFDAAQARRPGQVTPADVDPQLAGGAQLAAPTAGEIGEELTRATRRRRGSTGERIASDVRELTGRPMSAERAERLLTSRGRRIGRVVFGAVEEAYPEVDDPRLRRILDDEDVQRLWRRSQPREGENLGISHWQDLRERMMDFIEAPQNQTRFNRPNKDARAMIQRVSQLTATLEDIVPEYRIANELYANSQAAVRAFGQGARMYKSAKTTADEVVNEMQRIRRTAGRDADLAIEAFRHGATDEFVRKLLTQGTFWKRLTEMTPQRRQMVQALFPDGQDQFAEFIERLALEDRLSGLNIVTGGRAMAAGGLGSVRSALASPFVGIRYMMLREFLRRGLPASASAQADATLTRVLSREQGAMRAITALRPRSPGFAPGLLTGGAPAGSQVEGPEAPEVDIPSLLRRP